MTVSDWFLPSSLGPDCLGSQRSRWILRSQWELVKDYAAARFRCAVLSLFIFFYLLYFSIWQLMSRSQDAVGILIKVLLVLQVLGTVAFLGFLLAIIIARLLHPGEGVIVDLLRPLGQSTVESSQVGSVQRGLRFA